MWERRDGERQENEAMHFSWNFPQNMRGMKSGNRLLSCNLNFIGFLCFQPSLFYRSLFRFLLRYAYDGDMTIRVTGNEPEVRKGLNATFDLEERISFFAATFARRQMRERNSSAERESEWMSTRMRGGLIR